MNCTVARMGSTARKDVQCQIEFEWVEDPQREVAANVVGLLKIRGKLGD